MMLSEEIERLEFWCEEPGPYGLPAESVTALLVHLREAQALRDYIEKQNHRKGTFTVPTFDEFDSSWQYGCTVCRHSWPCEAAVLLGLE